MDSELGKKSEYQATYTPSLLFPIPRQQKRDEIGIVAGPLPFTGHDVWNAYEISWLNTKGKPLVAIGTFTFPCTSACIVESKSFKLYLNSFNNTNYSSKGEVHEALVADLSAACGAPVHVELNLLQDLQTSTLGASFAGSSLDDLDVAIDDYTVEPSVLKVSEDPTTVQECLHSNLLKSNCLVTGQPDWGSISIEYTGRRIVHETLLKYIISFRNHEEFHEQCVERVFTDVIRHCQPEELTVEARYTRRGGLDISPLRSTKASPAMQFQRLVRQ